MVVLKQDSDAILEEPLKSCAGTELLRAITKLYKHLTNYGLQPCLNMLDKE